MHDLLNEVRRIVAESVASHPQGHLFTQGLHHLPQEDSQIDTTAGGQHPPVVDQWLAKAVDAAPQPWAQLATKLGAHTTNLQWVGAYPHLRSTPELESFRAHYSYQLLVGPQMAGHHPAIASEEIITGFSIQAPNVLYPSHHHEPAEMYGIISGRLRWLVGETWSEVGPGDVIVHRPHEAHGMHTGDEPVLTWVIWPSNPHATVYMPSHDAPGTSRPPRSY